MKEQCSIPERDERVERARNDDRDRVAVEFDRPEVSATVEDVGT